MAKQLFINVAPWEVRVALVEDGQLVELQIERRAERSIAGNVYKGRVQRVLPGMQAAFCDVGLEKAAFLHASDLNWNALREAVDAELAATAPAPTAADAGAQEASPGEAAVADVAAAVDAPDTPPADVLLPETDGAPPVGAADVLADADAGDEAAEDDGAEAATPRPRRVLRPIEDVLRRGDELMLQVSKEPIGTKGARVTAHVSLPGRYLVYMPGTRHIGISRRIEDPAERDRLRAAVEAVRPPEGGFIVRTACEGMSEAELQEDVRFLTRLWQRIQKKAQMAGAPARLHQDLDLVLRIVRDLFTHDVDQLVIDDRAAFERVQEFVESLMPQLAGRIALHDAPTPLFDAHGLEQKIGRALERRVWLKSGGYLIFDQTESLTTVDVNTGRYVGKTDQEETVLRTNLEAARTVAQQLRLRNIGGIIVIDFIDMATPEHRQQVFDALMEATKADKARSNILEISEPGLVQMTRKRTRESLGQLLTDACPHCHGSGRTRSTETRAYDALREVQRRAAITPDAKRAVVLVHPEVAAWLRDQAPKHVRALETRLGIAVQVQGAGDVARDEARITLKTE